MNQNPDREQRALVILNPVSGTEDASDVRRRLEDKLTEAGWRYTIIETREDTEIVTMTREASPEAYDLVVAVGGDGTVSGVAGALVGIDVPLGIVPAGTGNALARDLDIPLQLDEAIALLTSPHSARMIDALQVGDHVYLLNVSAGISAATMKGTERSAKQSLGILAYILDLLRQLDRPQVTDFSLEIDGEMHQTRATEVAVLNTRLLDSDTIARYAGLELKDGDVAVIVLHARTAMDYISALWDFLTGRSDNSPHIETLTARRYITIKPQRPVPIQADGEPLDLTEVTIEILPKSIRVLTPE